MKTIPLALGGILLATVAFAQAAPTPPPPPGGPLAQDAGPPPRPGDRGPGGPGDRTPPPPPPSRGAAIHIERSVEGVLHLDVKCADPDPTKDCAEVTTQLLDKLGAASSKR